MTLPCRRVGDASARATYMILVGRGPIRDPYHDRDR